MHNLYRGIDSAPGMMVVLYNYQSKSRVNAWQITP